MTSDFLVMFLLKGVLGYLVQLYAIVIGMHSIARQPVEWARVSLVCACGAVLTWLVRSSPMLQFGVHTLLTCLIINIGCIFVCKMDVHKSVLGSIVMTILVLLSDIINFAVLKLFSNMDINEMQLFLQNERSKAISALPGNVSLVLVALLMYYFCVKRQKASA